ncbi:MAG: hypothetical protein PVI30_03975 [Myxococcales bacterium]|jgi:hypothetical protein
MIRTLAVAVALWGAGCIGTSPEQAQEDALGPEEPGVSQGPYHRAGQPCLRCHGEDHTPGGRVFVLAGTVYRRPDDERGVQGARVEVTDAAGHRFTARTNRVGTFFVSEGGGGEEAVRYDDGQVRIPYSLEFPLRVSVRDGELEQEMRGLVWREGSCGACHAGQPSASSNGRIFLEGGAP